MKTNEDNWNDYFYPGTTVLKNKFGITDETELTLVEANLVSNRIFEILYNPIKIQNLTDLRRVHKHLFQDIYDWAGQERTVNMQKNEISYLPLKQFRQGYHHVNIKISEYKRIQGDRVQEISTKLAEILDSANYLHMFREGNSRSLRIFIALLAHQKGFELNLQPADKPEVLRKYLRLKNSGNIPALAELIQDELKQITVPGKSSIRTKKKGKCIRQKNKN